MYTYQESIDILEDRMSGHEEVVVIAIERICARILVHRPAEAREKRLIGGGSIAPVGAEVGVRDEQHRFAAAHVVTGVVVVAREHPWQQLHDAGRWDWYADGWGDWQEVTPGGLLVLDIEANGDALAAEPHLGQLEPPAERLRAADGSEYSLGGDWQYQFLRTRVNLE